VTSGSNQLVEATALPPNKTDVMEDDFPLFVEEKIRCHYVLHEPLKAGFAQSEHQLQLNTKDGCSGITWDDEEWLVDSSRSKNSTFCLFWNFYYHFCYSLKDPSYFHSYQMWKSGCSNNSFDHKEIHSETSEKHSRQHRYSCQSSGVDEEVEVYSTLHVKHAQNLLG
jgi:hypothetical protein